MPRKFIRFRMPQVIGLFATLSHCLFLCKYCLEEGLTPIFAIENELYGRDWFDRLFRQRALPLAPDDEVESVLIRDRLEINRITRGAPEREISDEIISIAEGVRLFHHFLAIKEEVAGSLSAEATRLLDRPSVGVHYRGTDKFEMESLPVPYAEVVEAAERAAAREKSIYLATDDLNFFEFARARVPPARLKFLRKPAGQSHYFETGTFEKGLEALTDAWLLSRCSLLVKTPSLLSAWSVIFNPSLPLVLVGAPKKHPSALDYHLRNGLGFFPENLLHPSEGLRVEG